MDFSGWLRERGINPDIVTGVRRQGDTMVIEIPIGAVETDAAVVTGVDGRQYRRTARGEYQLIKPGGGLSWRTYSFSEIFPDRMHR